MSFTAEPLPAPAAPPLSSAPPAAPAAEETGRDAGPVAAPGSGGYRVRIEQFEGPFDLLLQLILQDDVDLYEVRVCEIVDAYLAEVARLEACDLDVSTEFLLIAATLLELKCRRLLPTDDGFDLDEELGLWEERDLLLARLLEAKTFKDAALVLRSVMDEAAKSQPRRAGLEAPFLAITPDPLAGMTAARLRRAFLRVASARPEPQVSVAHISVAKASVAEALEELLEVLPGRGRMSFRSLTAGIEERMEIVVRFLALLELFKQGLVDLDQATCFGDLQVAWTADQGRAGSTADHVLDDADLYEG